MPSNSHRSFDGAGREISSIGARVVRAWGVLDGERRLACGAAVLLFLSMFLPWYQQNAVVGSGRGEPLVSRNLSAFAIFSFVEAAILLVALATLALLFARAERRDFRLPAGDGTMIFVGGAWTGLLLIYRLFDKPGIAQHDVAANVGIQWGIFFALLASGLLMYAGSRMRLPRPYRSHLGPRPVADADLRSERPWHDPQREESFEGEATLRPTRPSRRDREPTVLLARNPSTDATVRLAGDADPTVHLDGDADPTVHLDGDADPTVHLDGDADPTVHLDGDADPTVHLEGDADPTVRLARSREAGEQLSFEEDD